MAVTQFCTIGAGDLGMCVIEYHVPRECASARDALRMHVRRVIISVAEEAKFTRTSISDLASDSHEAILRSSVSQCVSLTASLLLPLG